MKIEIFTSRDCKYCNLAKQLLNDNSLAFIEYDISKDPEHQALLLAKIPRVRSLPQIFTDDTHVGSYEDLKLMIERGELK